MSQLENSESQANTDFDKAASLGFVDWGMIDYQEALNKQLALVEEVHAQNSPGVLIFCKHPPVVTLGRATQPDDVFAWQGPTIEISRGGRATYHGPSQLVVYPIINLNWQSSHRPARDIGAFLRNFEQQIVDTLSEYGVVAQGRSLQKKSEHESADETGVWVQSQKIASLGIAIKKWITYHGAAINLHADPQAFVGLNPCGFHSSRMISLEQILSHPVNETEFKSRLLQRLHF